MVGTSRLTISRCPSTAPARSPGELDLADALDLDAALAQGAETLKVLGSTESLDVRRSLAAGQIAPRAKPALDLTPGHRTRDPIGPAGVPSPGRWCCTCTSPRPRSPAPAPTALELARVENQRQVVTADQIKTWCANPDAQVVVKPVVDLNEHIHVEGYEVPARLREQTMLRDHTCVSPWCTRSARKADADHVVPYAEGGTTSSDNIAPLCRRHHRLKTHSPWTYTMLEPGSFLWSSPHGYQFLRDHHGTLDVSRDRRRPRRSHRTRISTAPYPAAPAPGDPGTYARPLVSSVRPLRSLREASHLEAIRDASARFRTHDATPQRICSVGAACELRLPLRLPGAWSRLIPRF